MKKEALLARIDSVIQKGATVLSSVAPGPRGALQQFSATRHNPDYATVAADAGAAFRTSALSVVGSLYGTHHQHYKDLDAATKEASIVEQYKRGLAIVTTIREEVDSDWLDDARALIAADIFANILEMAEYLLSEGYKDPSAVLIGGSLEGHLRNLATRHSIDTRFKDTTGKDRPKKAETLNQELHKADAYKLGDQKQVTAWLDLRNDAAHGDHNKYTREQVVLMLQGVQNFIVRVPV